jgi:hypothetical protein
MLARKVYFSLFGKCYYQKQFIHFVCNDTLFGSLNAEGTKVSDEN